MDDSLFVRVKNEPILTAKDLPVNANGVFNPGAVEVDGETVLLLRIEERRGVSQIRVARSKNGVDNWRIAGEPLLEPDRPECPFEEWGCEDPRVTQVGPRLWAIAYTAFSSYGPAVAIALTSDFDSVTRLGIMLSPMNKDSAVFPEQFDGHWIMLHRPVTGVEEDIWYASSPGNLLNWSQPGLLMPQRGGPWWDGIRIGVGCPPIRTDEGWLLIYHGVKEMAVSPLYRIGVALLDLKDPRKVLARASEWVFSPEAEFEQHGNTPNVVFTCGATVRGDEVWMYYGAADTCVGLATAKVSDLLDFVHEKDFLHCIRREKGMM